MSGARHHAVPSDMRREAARALRDIEELTIPASDEELETLRLAVANDATAWGRAPSLGEVMIAVEDRNPRRPLYEARRLAAGLLKMSERGEDERAAMLLEDRARLRGARSAKNITAAEVEAIRTRWQARLAPLRAARQEAWER